MSGVDHIRGKTFHGRQDATRNAFSYGVDYILLDAETTIAGPLLFSRNRANLVALHDRDHGGAPGHGRGAAWVRDVLAAQGITLPWLRIELLAQPRVLGHVFNPVSFWLCRDGQDALRVVIAEVTNTYGDRHSYLCRRHDLGPIRPEDRLTASKVLHVSPFQPVDGAYHFNFDIRPERIHIRIAYDKPGGGMLATLTGTRRPLTNRSILSACLRRPFGSRRVLGLIHWQALKLWWKGAEFRARPAPPAEEVSG
ncbi:MAG: DUF1365 domain-containing protein [Rhodobacteraceae bacterium]|nr:DUF1365 domain-containing protein [Paracoccaceae bacterium]